MRLMPETVVAASYVWGISRWRVKSRYIRISKAVSPIPDQDGFTGCATGS